MMERARFAHRARQLNQVTGVDMLSKEKPRMLIIGARGLVGTYAVRGLAADFEVIRGNRTALGQPGETQIDITSESSVKAAFDGTRPDAVLLLAAISDIDRCEASPKEAVAVNVRGTEFVAEACARAQAKLLFTSSGAVFDGQEHGYTEQSPTSPVSVYGETKVRAEALVLALVPSALVLRLALVLGFAAKPGTNGLLDTLGQRWSRGEVVALPTFEYRNPVDASTLVHYMAALWRNPGVQGIFHVGSSDLISRYHLGLKLAERMGHSGLVQPQSEPTRGRAPRGPSHFLLTDRIHAACAIPIPTCDQVIARCFDAAA